MAQRNAIEVVAGLIRRADGKVLICLRPKHLDQGGLWEFPGGKRENGESRFGALRRELNEELGIEISAALPLLRVIHRYPTKTIDLDVWEVSAWHGSARGREGQRITWVTPSKLDCYTFPAANRTIITAASLSRTILTMPDLGSSPTQSLAALDAWLAAGARCFLLPNQYLINFMDDHLLTQIGHRLRRFGAKLVLDWPQKEATTAADGDYRQNLESLRRLSDCDVLAGFPCRTLDHLERAEQVGADLLLIGPIGSTDSKTENDVLGWNETLRLVAMTMTPAFAFGEWDPEYMTSAIVSGCQGLVLPSSVWATDATVVMDSVANVIAGIKVEDECA